MAFDAIPNKPKPEDLKVVTGNFNLSEITRPIERLLAENAFRIEAIRDKFATIRTELDNIKYQLEMAKGTSKPFEYLMEIDVGLQRLNAIVRDNTKK